MKASDINEASKLLTEYSAIKQHLEAAEKADHFRMDMSYGPEAWARVAGSAGEDSGVVQLNNGGSFGAMASDLKAAAVTYYKFHVELIRAQLEKLGVEP